MKTVGIIGGIGPEATIDYYRAIISRYRERKSDGTSPAIIINSIDLKRMVGFVEAGERAGLIDYLLHEVERLASAGADFGLLAANTPHMVFDDVQRRCRIPLISIIQATCTAAKDLGLKKLGLLGTRFTMQGHFYAAVFEKQNISLATPSREEQEFIHEKYFAELVKGIFLPETRERLLQIADRMRRHEGIEGVILAGTELPLILRGAHDLGIPFLDTTQIHVRAVVELLIR